MRVPARRPDAYHPCVRPDPASLVDLARYPVDTPDSPAAVAAIATARADLARQGVAVLPGFLAPDALDAMVAEADALAVGRHHQDVMGTPYLEIPADHWPPTHPRRTEGRSALTAIPYDAFGEDSPLRALYEWDALREFVRRTLDRPTLHRYADPLGALNVATMHDGDELAWHFDQTDFVVSIALQRSERGGEFECAPFTRTADDECYDTVADCLEGHPDAPTTVLEFEPGTLMLFAGRHSLHRVTRIGGPTPRHVALLGYDAAPGVCSSDILRLIRYGRTA
ncbi:MAG: hypothetical protein RL531_1671 [Actinomycetota bacterium]